MRTQARTPPPESQASFRPVQSTPFAQSAVWANGVLWTGLNDACDSGGGVRACVRIDQFSVTDTGVATVQDGDLGVPGWDLFYPAVELDGSGNLVVGLNVSNASTFASTAMTGLLNSSNGNFTGTRIVHLG